MAERPHLSHKEYLAYRRGQVIVLVHRAQSGEFGLLLAVREIHGILWELADLEKKPESADVLFLKGVSSECDDLPLGSERQYWAPDSLREKDARAADYEARIRDKVLLAFARIADDLMQLL
jgi:hypothetical protein